MKKLTRRNVVLTMTSATITLCPAILNAQATDFTWDAGTPTDKPLGQDQTMMLAAGESEVEISALQPGQVAVVGRTTDDGAYTNTGGVRYIAVLRRNDAQMAIEAPATAVQDPNYFVADLTCPHRGFAIGMTGLPDAPFACTKTGSRHKSVFNAGGLGISGASDGDLMSVPDHTIENRGASVVVRFA